MQMKAMFSGILIAGLAATAQAQESADDFVGFWKTAQGDGIVQLERCPMYKFAPPTALCGTIVWDAEVNNPHRTSPLDCNRKVFEATRYEAGVWKGGWAFDTRARKFYSVKLRMKGGDLSVRAFVGSEMNGQTETFTRVEAVPPGCEQRAPEAPSLKSSGK
jgi:uncharacterized protein (DUF2147 family)